MAHALARKPLVEDLEQLDKKLADRSYIGGGIQATQEDIELHGSLQVAPNAELYPHLARWHRHITGLRARYASYHEWAPGGGPAAAAAPSGAPKKGRAAGKEKKELEVDCKAVPVEDTSQPSPTAPELGPGSQCLESRKGGGGGAKRRTYYVTTAIHYMNGNPHVGHAYENMIADIFTRFHRMMGEDVYFMTGGDEHGQKIAETAAGLGLKPIELVDKKTLVFQALNQRLRISNDFYMRTTSEQHKATAVEMWNRCKASGDIYLGKYEGWYLVREERFITDQEAEELNFMDNGKPLTKMSEPSFFFRLGKYQKPVMDYIESHPEFVQPEKFRQEVLERLRSIELRDLSISRGAFSWGVPCPEDAVEGKNHVFYVWFDALTNYVTAAEGMDKSSPSSRFWPANMHLIGKDILWFHTVYWPAMLMSAGLALPRAVVVHGHIAGPDGRKMSKTYGNVVDPHVELNRFSLDTLRWYLSREASFGDDLKFNQESLALMHNADLCDNLGNLVNRAVSLCGGTIPDCKEVPGQLPFDLAALKATTIAAMEAYRLSDAADATIQACRATNKWIADLEPWKMKAEEQQALRAACFRYLLEAVYALAHFFSPFLPTACAAIFKKLQVEPMPIPELSDDFKNLPTGGPVTSSSILFEQLDPSKYKVVKPDAPAEGSTDKAKDGAAAGKTKGKAKADAKAAPAPDEDNPNQPLFSKLDIRVGRVMKAWNHPEADRLYVEEIDVGEEKPRQIVSGLREHLPLEEFQGRKLLVVCNMKPSKLVKVESSGMVLCAKNAEKGVVELLDVPEGCEVGTRVLCEGIESSWAPFKPDSVKKKKIWESVAEQLRTDTDRVACFAGAPLTTSGGVRFQAPTQAGMPVS